MLINYKTLICLLSVFNQGDEGKSWYIILKGSVNVVIYGKVCMLGQRAIIGPLWARELTQT